MNLWRTYRTAIALVLAGLGLIGFGWFTHSRTTARPDDVVVFGEIVSVEERHVTNNRRQRSERECLPTVEYEVDGVRHSTTPAMSAGGWCRPRGSVVQVGYNPADPADAVVVDEAADDRFLMFGGIGAACLLAGLVAGLWTAVRRSG